MLSNIGLNDGIGLDDVLYVAAGIGTIGAAYAVLVRPVLSRLRVMLTWWEKFARDWDGEEAEPGRDRMPGVMERLNAIDGELKRNGGSSLKDQVCATHRSVDWLTEQIGVIEARQREIQTLTMATAERLDAHIHGAQSSDARSS